jgi:hypothetical protein
MLRNLSIKRRRHTVYWGEKSKIAKQSVKQTKITVTRTLKLKTWTNFSYRWIDTVGSKLTVPFVRHKKQNWKPIHSADTKSEHEIDRLDTNIIGIGRSICRTFRSCFACMSNLRLWVIYEYSQVGRIVQFLTEQCSVIVIWGNRSSNIS